MTDEEIKKNWAEMSKDFKLDIHICIGGNFNNTKTVRSMTLESRLLSFKIIQSNSILMVSGDYGTYVFRDVHDIFKNKTNEHFMADNYEMFKGNLISTDVNYSSFSNDFIKSLAAFKYSCEAIKMAVKNIRRWENEN